MKRSSAICFLLTMAVGIMTVVQGCGGDEIEISDKPVPGKIEKQDPEPDPGPDPGPEPLINPELTWSASSYDVVYGSEYSFPTLVNSHDVTVTYTSSSEEVATIAPDGTVTVNAAGSTTITAGSGETDRYEASSASYTLTVAKAEGGLEWSEESLTAVFGEDTAFPILSNPNSLEISWFSSDESVAAVDSSGTVTIVGAGVTAITANSAETDRYESCSVSYDISVRRAESGLAWTAQEVDATMGKECDFPELSNPNGLEISWSSSDENVARIESDGTVTILAAGVTTISASTSENAGYMAGSASYTLTVGKNASVISWSAATCKAKIGEDNTFPSLDNPGGQEISYSSSDEGIASVFPDGSVIIRSPGTVTITATALEDDSHERGSAIYSLEVGAPDVKLKDPGLSWPAGSLTLPVLGSHKDPVLNNPNKLKVTYSSSSPNVAAVKSDGSLSLKSPGVTTITASSKSTDVFYAGSASYVLTVDKAPAGIAWSDSTAVTNIGSPYSPPSVINPYKLSVDYSSSNTSVAGISPEGYVTIVNPGTTTITVSSKETSFFQAGSASYTLNVIKKSPPLSWSQGSVAATLTKENTFPTLSNPLELEVSYSSSNTSVARISGSGEITLTGAGTVTITATSKETEEYASAGVSYRLAVKKDTPTLAWSESSCSVALDETFSLPVLDNPGGLAVTYSSSDRNTATVSDDGKVTVIKKGTTTITAKFKGDNYYNQVSASYTLTVVKTNTDNGIGTFRYASTGDRSSDDDISNTTFTRMITVTFSNRGDATVEGDFYDYVTVSGNYVTVNNTGNDEFIVYKLTGSTSKGSFKLNSQKKQAILLNGVSISNPNGAAINIQSSKRTYVMADGSNTLSDAASAQYDSGNEDMKAVFFSEGQLVFSGSGSLSVNAVNKTGKSGIVSDDYIRFMAGSNVSVTASSQAGHGIKGKQYVRISDGILNVSAAAAMKKGITSEDYVLVEGGTTDITITGGVGYDSQDKEYKGTAGIKADNYFGMTGGSVTIRNTGTGGKGIGAGSYDYDGNNHLLADSYVSGGTLNITTSGNEAYDVSSKGIKIGYKQLTGRYYVTAGNLVISGGKVTVDAARGEGIEAKGNITFTGGETSVISNADDAINCLGEMNVNGGYVFAWSSQNDAMDANGDMKLNGGVVFAINTKGTPEMALDAATETGHRLFINSGATVIAFGRLEGGYSASQAVYSMNATPGAWNAIHDGTSFIAAFKAPSGLSTFVVSAPSLSAGFKDVSVGGDTFCGGTLATSGISGGTATGLDAYSGGSGYPGGGWWP